MGKESFCNAEDPGSIPGLGRSPGKGNGNALGILSWRSPMGREAWWATVHGVTKSWAPKTTASPSIEVLIPAYDSARGPSWASGWTGVAVRPLGSSGGPVSWQRPPHVPTQGGAVVPGIILPFPTPRPCLQPPPQAALMSSSGMAQWNFRPFTPLTPSS